MSQDRDKDEMDRSFWAASILSILSLILSIISILDDDPMFFALLLTLFFAFGFYAFGKWDKKKKASYYRILEDEKRKARELLSSRSKRRFSRNKKVGAVVSVVSLILSIVFFADEDFMLFALFLVICLSSAVVSLMAGKPSKL